MPVDTGAYWQSILDAIEDPIAAESRDLQLDMSDVTGVKASVAIKPPCFDLFAEVKKIHPDKLVLIQNGKFYEAIGYDAVLLMECGLKAMKLSKKGKPIPGYPPRTGFPKASLSKYRREIVDKMQLSIVLCDQYDVPSDHNGTEIARKISAIYNPGEQSYSDHDDFPVPTSSMICLSWEPDGFAIAEFRLDQSAVQVTFGMTEDALWGQLASKSVAAPICIHASFAGRVQDWKLRVKRVVPVVANRIRRLEQPDGMTEFVDFLRQHNGFEASHVISVEHTRTDRSRRCPSFQTASQLGITGETSIPNLLDCIVPDETLDPVKAWLRDLLLVPRSMEATHQIRKALQMIQASTDSFPRLRTYMSPGGVVKVRPLLDNTCRQTDLGFKGSGAVCCLLQKSTQFVVGRGVHV